MSTGSDSTTSFGVFELDRRSGELRKAGVRVKLAAQPFQLLVALLDRAGEVVHEDRDAVQGGRRRGHRTGRLRRS